MLQGNNGKHWGLQDGTNYYTLPFLFLCPISNIEKIFMHILVFRLHWWLPLKPPLWSGGEECFHTRPMVQYWSVPEEVEGWTVNHPQALAYSCKDLQHEWRLNIRLPLQQFSRWDASLYVPSMMLISKGSRCCMRNLLLVQLCNGVAECWSYIMLYFDVFQLWNPASLIWKWNILCA